MFQFITKLLPSLYKSILSLEIKIVNFQFSVEINFLSFLTMMTIYGLSSFLFIIQTKLQFVIFLQTFRDSMSAKDPDLNFLFQTFC